MTTDTVTAFDQLALSKPILKALDEVGYESPSPIQAETIPLLLEGRDVLGQAQTGTGKTAAFALPLLSNLDLKQKNPQVLVLAPTRELAIQVAEAFQKYAKHLKGFHVLPVYGGQDYRGQIRALQRGVHVVVGTPGRVMDHMRRGTLKLDQLSAMVLDEADEMLRMGFVDDVEWILEQTPDERQIALFSATMPAQIRRIATRYLRNPAQITIKTKTATVDTIRQRFWPVSGMHKLDALTRICEAEPFDAMIVFVRTKTATVELAEKLSARGYAAAAINGDIQQNLRERSINNLKKGKLDILVATDVAARGLDVERISHVVNYDIPYDTEAYVHRIGRTGRAGRQGDAILFVAPREKRLLYSIEQATRKKIERMELPSTEIINDKRIDKFKQRITDTLATEEMGIFYQLIERYQQEHNVPALEIAAALAYLLQGDTPLLLQNKPQRQSRDSWDRDDRPASNKRGDKRGNKRDSKRENSRDSGEAKIRPRKERTPKKEMPPAEGLERFRIEVGHSHDVQPGNIVGAIANEAGLDGKNIGHIKIHDDFSYVDLPEGMPKEVFQDLIKTRVAGQALKISRVGADGKPVAVDKKSEKRSKLKAKPKSKDKKSPRKKSATKD
ncbi:MAG: DEAD/DEAH box helicase [Gammaproteobacteria bacterium]|nr:DEAD/DEAH box helicase [Gammaproteobacteria bacterium]